MKVLVLGAGQCQLSLIKKLLTMGHEVIVTDYLTTSPGKDLVERHYLVSTFDEQACLEIAKKEQVDAVMTSGTDQPINTLAYIAEYYPIKSFLTVDQAKCFTHKEAMKNKLAELGLPLVPWLVYQPGQPVPFSGPYIIKPADNQGQRGVYLVKDPEDLPSYYEKALPFSRTKRVLVEGYYEHKELTMSGWVQGGKLHVLSITDRDTFSAGPHLGICKGHHYPSRYLDQVSQSVRDLSERIVKGLEVEEGPVYFQFFYGREGLKVNEIAARLGGAYEDQFIPLATGVDLLALLIDAYLGQEEKVPLKPYYEAKKWLYTYLLFSKNGYMPSEKIEDFPGILQGAYFSQQVTGRKIENGAARIGYGILQGTSKADLQEKRKAFEKIHGLGGIPYEA